MTIRQYIIKHYNRGMNADALSEFILKDSGVTIRPGAIRTLAARMRQEKIDIPKQLNRNEVLPVGTISHQASGRIRKKIAEGVWIDWTIKDRTPAPRMTEVEPKCTRQKSTASVKPRVSAAYIPREPKYPIGSIRVKNGYRYIKTENGWQYVKKPRSPKPPSTPRPMKKIVLKNSRRTCADKPIRIRKQELVAPAIKRPNKLGVSEIPEVRKLNQFNPETHERVWVPERKLWRERLKTKVS